MESVIYDSEGKPQFLMERLKNKITIDGGEYFLIDWLSYKGDSDQSRNSRMSNREQEINYYLEK